MVMIKIRDHVAGASTYEDGDVIFRLLAENLEAGREVEVSFEGISAVPSAFVNAAFVRLLDIVSFERLRSSVKFRQSTRAINELLRHRLTFVAGQSATP